MHVSTRRITSVLAAATSSGLLAVALVAAGPAAAGAAEAACPASAVRTFVPPTGTDNPFGITEGPGGTYVAHGATIDVIAGGRLTEHAVATPTKADVGWLAWRGGHATAVWFADRGTGRLGTITATGAVHEVQIPAAGTSSAVPQAIVFRAGAVWFTDQANDRIGRYTPADGRFRFYPVPSADAQPLGMVLGHDDNLYFTERADVPKVGRLDPRTGLFTEWSLRANAFPNRLAVGPRGGIWFTELGVNSIGRLTPTGHLVEYPVPGGPVGLTVHDGYLYTALYAAGQLARLDLRGHVLRRWSLPHAGGVLQVAASNGAVWVTDGFANHVYRVAVSC